MIQSIYGSLDSFSLLGLNHTQNAATRYIVFVDVGSIYLHNP